LEKKKKKRGTDRNAPGKKRGVTPKFTREKGGEKRCFLSNSWTAKNAKKKLPHLQKEGGKSAHTKESTSPEKQVPQLKRESPKQTNL